MAGRFETRRVPRLRRSQPGPFGPLRPLLYLLPVLAVAPAAGAAESGRPEALPEAGAALVAGALDPADPRRDALAWLIKSRMAEREGDLVQALAHARHAERADPTHAAAPAAVGRLLAALGSHEPALEALARARRLAPDEGGAYLLAALLLRDLNRASEAIALLEEARAGEVGEPEVSRELGLLLLREGRLEEAREVARQAIERTPGDGGLLLVLGLALASQPAERARAITLLEGALAYGTPQPARVRVELAALLLEEGRSGEAVDHLRKAIDLEPESVEAHYRLAAALRAAGDGEEAARALADFRQLDRTRTSAETAAKEAGIALNDARVLVEEDRLPEALELLEHLLVTHPDLGEALSLRGKVLMSLGQPSAALASIERAREVEPHRVEHHYLAGLLLTGLGTPGAAEEALERSLALDPRLAEAQVLLAKIASDQARYAEAAERFERALEIGAEGPTLRLAYAEALEQIGRLEESRAQAEAARRLTEP